MTADKTPPTDDTVHDDNSADEVALDEPTTSSDEGDVPEAATESAEPQAPEARTQRPSRHWLVDGLSRGALAGLLTAALTAGVDAALASARSEELAGGGSGRLWLYAVGLLGLLLVPYGAFLGAGLRGIVGTDGTIRGWFGRMGRDPEADVRWTSVLVGVLGGNSG